MDMVSGGVLMFGGDEVRHVAITDKGIALITDKDSHVLDWGKREKEDPQARELLKELLERHIRSDTTYGISLRDGWE